MCQAIPRRVLEVDGERVQVDYDGQPTWVHAVALPDLTVGEYVVVYAGQALERMDEAEADELLAFYGGLEPLLRRFTGALPYLQLIARANAIADPFDPRVVEAYWLGNELLDGVEVRQLYDALLERFGKQLTGRTRELVLGKAPAGARPHHAFHVLDVHSRVGELDTSLLTLDQCRVSWGQVRSLEGAELVVSSQPLVLQAGKLVLGP